MIVLDCINPNYKQPIYEDNIEINLDDENKVILMNDIIDYQKYVDNIVNTYRVRGKTSYNYDKPRYEVCYTHDGTSYKYSNIDHYTTKFPQHILDLSNELLEKLNLNANLSHCVDIHYSHEIVGGGSIAKHQDNEQNWNIVLIYSLGQSRILRISSDKNILFNIKMKHNSLVAMIGSTFQQKYFHQVDKLTKKDTIGDRYSINFRYHQ